MFTTASSAILNAVRIICLPLACFPEQHALTVATVKTIQRREFEQRAEVMSQANIVGHMIEYGIQYHVLTSQ